MVCPNCHSDQIIAVQDQHFCINCGQAVPPEAVAKGAAAPAVRVQANGLPEGVKVLPMATETKVPAPPPPEPATAKLKKRKPGRPKAGRLDVPRHQTAPSAPPPLPAAPRISTAQTGHRLNDLAPPRKPAAQQTAAARKPSGHKPPRSRSAHRVGVPPLHYRPVLAFSLRSGLRPHLLGVAALGSATLAAASGYLAWLILSGGLTNLPSLLSRQLAPLATEMVVLAALYYLGRSIGQAAIIYGVAREADHRPVSLARQFGVGVNTFAKRLALDLLVGLGELVLLGLIAGLVLFGGSTWPVDLLAQVVAIFVVFLVLLYSLTALAITRGLAGVALTLTSRSIRQAARLGWQLFSHRFELLGLRFLGIAMELLLATPLAVLGVVVIVASPADSKLLATLAVTLLAWFAGALLGAGTATWWSELYRRLILADRPDATVSLLSSRMPADANRGPLILLVALATFLVCAALVIPWIGRAA